MERTNRQAAKNAKVFGIVDDALDATLEQKILALSAAWRFTLSLRFGRCALFDSEEQATERKSAAHSVRFEEAQRRGAISRRDDDVRHVEAFEDRSSLAFGSFRSEETA